MIEKKALDKHYGKLINLMLYCHKKGLVYPQNKLIGIMHELIISLRK